MNQWTESMRKSKNRLIKEHPNGVFAIGSLEPIMTVLEVRGFELRDLFLIGMNDNCGSIVLPTHDRAQEASRALEPAYQAVIEQPNGSPYWHVKFDRRVNGEVPSWFVTDITLKDGREVMKNGRWVR